MFLSDGMALPFGSLLPWDAMSIHVAEKDVSKLPAILRAIPQSRVAAMRAKVLQYRRAYCYCCSDNHPHSLMAMIFRALQTRRLSRPVVI